MPHLIRTRFKNDIIAEIGFPKKPNGKLGILLQGCPSMPSEATQRFLMKRGFTVIQPRYRGTWESNGSFLELSPEQDILDILDGLEGELVDAWSSEPFHVEHDEVIIICSSFGGAAGILASRDPRISKVVAFSPVIDWGAEGPAETFDQMKRFIKDGFGEGYRFNPEDFEKLTTGEFYNPWAHMKEIDGRKLFIIQADDDMITIPGPALEFAEVTKSKLLLLKQGGHFGTGKLREWRMWWRIRNFLK